MEREGYQPEGPAEGITETGETLENGTEVVELAPEHPKTEVPTLWAGGFGTNVESYRPALSELAERGRTVVAFTHPREGVEPAHHKGMLPKEERDNALPPAELRRALDLLEVMNAKGIAKADVVGHSMGGASAVMAAIGAPERFRSLVLIDSVGLVGKHTPPELLGRYLQSQQGSAWRSFRSGGAVRDNYLRYMGEGTKEALRNLPLTAQESIDVTQTDLTPLLAELHERGIKVSIVHATEDALFPFEKVQRMVRAEDIDGFVTIRGQHEESFVFRPTEVMAATDELLTAMERKYERERREAEEV